MAEVRFGKHVADCVQSTGYLCGCLSMGDRRRVRVRFVGKDGRSLWLDLNPDEARHLSSDLIRGIVWLNIDEAGRTAEKIREIGRDLADLADLAALDGKAVPR